ncbi:MAG: hypothetical protein AB7I04_18445 [Pseudomonadales bacterium]
MTVLDRIDSAAFRAPFLGSSKPSHARHPNVPTRRVALTEALRAQQILKGFYVEVEGEKYALPIDSWEDRRTFLGVEMWRDGYAMPHRFGARAKSPGTQWQAKALAWLRDHVSNSIPPLYYRVVLGHDLHVSTWADLYAKQWHVGWASPFDPGDGSSLRGALDPTFATYFATHFGKPGEDPTWPEQWDLLAYRRHWESCRLGESCPSWMPADAADLQAIRWQRAVLVESMQRQRGFVENLGWLSGAKVTSAFVSEEIDELVSATSSEYADFDYHEVGTSSTAESNAHTALQTSSGIARATGTPTDADPIYRSVATITADASETWEEHGIFNNSSGAAMMDRNLTGGQAVVSSDQVQYTFELTKNPEA